MPAILLYIEEVQASGTLPKVNRNNKAKQNLNPEGCTLSIHIYNTYRYMCVYVYKDI